MENKMLRNIIVYFLLIAGYFLLYAVDVEHVFYPEQEQEVKSRVDFVYQQF
ncbi:MAG: hypothetical protein ACO1O6_05260 [Bacteroidota bacterium]